MPTLQVKWERCAETDFKHLGRFQ